jgi:hypothetical protein
MSVVLGSTMQNPINATHLYIDCVHGVIVYIHIKSMDIDIRIYVQKYGGAYIQGYVYICVLYVYIYISHSNAVFHDIIAPLYLAGFLPGLLLPMPPASALGAPLLAS